MRCFRLKLQLEELTPVTISTVSAGDADICEDISDGATAVEVVSLINEETGPFGWFVDAVAEVTHVVADAVSRSSN